MKVGIDLSSLVYHRGVSRYTSNLYRGLAGIEGVELFGYASAGPRARQKLDQDLAALKKSLPEAARQNFDRNLKKQNFPPKLTKILWHDLHLNSIKKAMPEIEVFHSWDYLQPPDKKIPLVSTIHDVAMLRFPETAHPEILKQHQKCWQILKARHAHIIAVSETTKRDVIELLGFPTSHVHRVYSALPSEPLVPDTELTTQNWWQVQNKYNLRRPFLLAVGTREPRKNLNAIVQAWWPLRDSLDLVIVGAAGWDENLSATPQLFLLEKVTDRELALLYAHAQMLVFASLYEGFGLPILESFAYSTPVVTSNNSATAEVAGQAAVLVDPTNVQQIYAGISQILSENDAQKAARRQAMQTQLQQFSWQKTALETANVYVQAIEGFYA